MLNLPAAAYSSPRLKPPTERPTTLSEHVRDVLQNLEVVRDAASKFAAGAAPPANDEILNTTVRALLYRIPKVQEFLLSLLGDTDSVPSDREAEPATPPRPTPTMNPALLNDIRSSSKATAAAGTTTSNPNPNAPNSNAAPAPVTATSTGTAPGSVSTVKGPVVKKPPPQPPSKKAPPLVAKKPPPILKKPPPGKKPPPSAKKPPPTQGFVVKPEPSEPSPIDADLAPEVQPAKKLVPKPIQWQGLPREKTKGTIWEDLLKKDRQLLPVKDWQKRSGRVGRSPDATKGLPPTPLQLPLAEATSDASTQETDGGVGGSTEFKFEVEFEKLDKLFFEDEEVKKQAAQKRASLAEAAAAAAKKRVYSVLDEKRTRNVEISLKGLGLRDDFDRISNAINNLQFGTEGEEDDSFRHKTNAGDATGSRRRPLRPEDLSLLLGLYPKEEDEIRKLRKLEKDPPADQKIATADRFLLTLLNIPRFRERVEAVLSRLTFKNDIAVALEKATKLYTICDVASQSVRSGTLKAVLALILKMGNYVNCSSKKPVVAGLQVNALESLKGIKSVDGSKTFLRIAAEHIDEQYKGAWAQLEWLERCGEAADINVDDLYQLARGLQKKLDDIGNELTHAREHDDKKFIEVFEPFFKEACIKLSELKNRLDEAKAKLLLVASAFADKAKTPKEAQEIMRKLDQFGKDLGKARREVEAEKVAIERRRAHQERTPLAQRPSRVVSRIRRPTPCSPKLSSVLSSPHQESAMAAAAANAQSTANGSTTPFAVPLHHHRSLVQPSHQQVESPPQPLKRGLSAVETALIPKGAASQSRASISRPPVEKHRMNPSMAVVHTQSPLGAAGQPSVTEMRRKESSPQELPVDAARNSLAKHKKTRSHTLHKSVKSVHESMGSSPGPVPLVPRRTVKMSTSGSSERYSLREYSLGRPPAGTSGYDPAMRYTESDSGDSLGHLYQSNREARYAAAYVPTASSEAAYVSVAAAGEPLSARVMAPPPNSDYERRLSLTAGQRYSPARWLSGGDDPSASTYSSRHSPPVRFMGHTTMSEAAAQPAPRHSVTPQRWPHDGFVPDMHFYDRQLRYEHPRRRN